MKIEFRIFSKIVNFYPYRTARVCGVSIKSENHDLYEQVREFVEKNDYRMDNHICFKTDNGIYFMWSGNCLYVGTKVHIGNW